MERQTILLISPYWKEAHRWMVSSVKLSELWQRLGYRVVVACMGEKTETRKISDTLVVHTKKDIFLKDPWNYGIAFGFSGMVRGLIREEKPDVIVINKILFWTSLCALSMRLRGIRPILLTDALVGLTWWPRGRFPRIGAFLYARTLGWLVLCSASKIVFFHPQPEKLLRRLGIARKSRVIPTGIDPLPYHREKQREPGSITVTYVGRIESVKGVDDFLAAIDGVLTWERSLLVRKHPAITVQVVGYYEKGNALVEKYKDRVRFPGLRDDIPEILSKTDIFVLPSHSEGLSNALMEAMASGCACIASDVGGNAFLIQNGISGFLFPAGDREALTAHVKRLLLDPAKRQALGEAAEKRIEEQFSWDIVGKQYRSLFES